MYKVRVCRLSTNVKLGHVGDIMYVHNKKVAIVLLD
jgi:hypothetical protein